ncbi:Acetyltransferase (GNAT) family protein [Pirellulimonas nuda]|uniref:Acetyltransferase (GNAT) family protein n=1 Tax=Pirellulimonas nuda TaxID=2528009 RepID=A0A518D5F8_9BACT|nr:GNAT family N-acetyltransferase [Pirellulimonas nuda]QDU86703.1 Acetyltransferase (GNAT) family protein [Pirellulimonas nuda]
MSDRLIAIGEDGSPEEPVDGPAELLRTVQEGCAALYRRHGHNPPWIVYLYLVDGACVGSCAFKSPPADDRVEIAYFTLPGFEGRGHATAMARRLVDIAREADHAIELVAQTLPEPNASTAILTKLGFCYSHDAHDPEVGRVWEWRLRAGVV